MFVNSRILEKYFQWMYRPGRGGGFSLGLDRCFAYRTTEYIFDGKTARHEIQGDCHSTEYFD